ncbi:hypothetical protein [Dyadobacter fanqingshengii]|uniref:Glycosyltransferase family 1 protein n=1 Tax=Dyadobacter fanqingshengii TaxID=2906443 RepID=A0A9X1TBZ2_9BACT|nr:hypothetical protein [Dyadobacter fanqingshengii]MCF0042529.1 hypothetical protein [Dyadobacter fanqingshengii]USJ36243.1 hypothetical protein NFI81_00400 [Dyadobacter fanqingshengii]
MNLVSIPYHDWRKISKEGARTRDAHFLHHLANHEKVSKLLVVNRPTTHLEILVKGNSINIEGQVIHKRGGFKLYKVSENMFVIDYITLDILGQALNKKKWFFDIFADQHLNAFYKECLDLLKMNDPVIFNKNIFAYKFIENNSHSKSVFDAWDNFLQFPDNKSIEEELKTAYSSLSSHASKWITNSKKNIDYFTNLLNIPAPVLIKNGVDFETFRKKYEVPEDMKTITRPIIGFGGKISHLFDWEMYNYCLEKHPDKSFVIVGQVLDKKVFNNISKSKNFHYLGDKHYSKYPAYVCNFDVGIIPYVNNHLDSGADSIKAYEYLAARLPSVGSRGAGMADLSEFMLIADDKESFSLLIDKAVNTKVEINLSPDHSWKSKTDSFIELASKL